MFVITTTKNKTITWPVKVEVATDGGKTVKHEFTGTFKLLDDDEREALAAEAEANQPATADVDADLAAEPDNAWKERSVDNILKSMVGWTGVCDESKNPVEFNRPNLLSVARSAHGLSFLRAIGTALTEIATGARAKN